MIYSFLWLFAGFILLIAGGELLVRGAVRLAERAGMSQLLIGLTIVAFGTSAPELVASIGAAMQGYPAIAWGNVIGSNLANSLLILGLASLIYPMAVARGPLWRDGGLAAVITLLLWAAAHFGFISITLGAVFLLILAGYLVYAYKAESSQGPLVTAAGDKAGALEVTDTQLHIEQPVWQSLAVLALGMLGIILGGRWLVDGAVDIAEWLGMSEAVIGLTVIAIGTSLPELVTAVIAARKGASAVALGNILGSNLFNLLLIGGLTAIVAPAAMPAALLTLSLPALAFISLLLLLFAATQHRISRSEGVILLAIYIALMVYNLIAV